MNATPEYWRWSEGNWRDQAMDWREANSVTVGIDVGSVSSEAVICLDGILFAWNTIRTGSSSPKAAENALKGVLEITGIPREAVNFVVGTGYGKVNVPFADKTITEIACHARGASYIGGPTVRTVLDMGGQDLKVITIDEAGRVLDFLMNDKCAAGTGRGMEVIADLLEVPIGELGERSFDVPEEPPAVSDVCVVFARTEAMARLKEGWSKNMVIASYCRAMAERVSALLKRLGLEREFLITGGISKNIGIVRRIEALTGVTALKPSIDTQIAGALGAALFAWDFHRKARK